MYRGKNAISSIYFYSSHAAIRIVSIFIQVFLVLFFIFVGLLRVEVWHILLSSDFTVVNGDWFLLHYLPTRLIGISLLLKQSHRTLLFLIKGKNRAYLIKGID